MQEFSYSLSLSLQLTVATDPRLFEFMGNNRPTPLIAETIFIVFFYLFTSLPLLVGEMLQVFNTWTMPRFCADAGGAPETRLIYLKLKLIKTGAEPKLIKTFVDFRHTPLSEQCFPNF